MIAEDAQQTAGLSIAGFSRWSGGASKHERNFYIALACAVLLHASFFIGAITNGHAKRLGSENGSDDAISVSLVTEADLKSRAMADEPVTPPPGPIAPTQEAQPPPQPKPEEAKPEAQPEPPPPPPQAQEQPQPETPPDVQAETAEPDPVKPVQELAKLDDASPDTNPPDLFSLQDEDPTKMQSQQEPKPNPEAKPVSKPEPKPETKKAAKAPPKQPAKQPAKPKKTDLAALDLSTPVAPSFGGGGGAAFQRPPGITRSGLNDAFARAVIRALQQTMPQLTDAFGRVTVRILLSESGNVVEVKLLSGSKNSSLNQDVVFAAQQTSYPIPPAGSNLADRTFMVTYIYD